MKKFFIAFILIFAATAAFLFFFSPKKIQQTEPTSLSTPSSASSIPNQEKAAHLAIAEAAKTASPEEARAELISFVRSETKGMDTKITDDVGAEERVEAQAEKLTAPDIAYLKKTLIDPTASANEKIFGIFLLGKGKNKTTSALGDFVRQPFRTRSNPAPHTIEESKLMQEKTYAYMAVDALVDQVKAGSEVALAELNSLASEAPDPGVRSYVLRKLAELSAR